MEDNSTLDARRSTCATLSMGELVVAQFGSHGKSYCQSVLWRIPQAIIIKVSDLIGIGLRTIEFQFEEKRETPPERRRMGGK